MAQRLVIYDDVTKEIKYLPASSVPGQVPVMGRSNALTQGTTQATINFLVPFTAGGTIIVVPTWYNPSTGGDANPQQQVLTVTASDENGFTVKWPAGLDTGNHRINYVATRI